nr:hypothetical protein Iba_scaffold1551122CG0010 [Ipomoea batatas]
MANPSVFYHASEIPIEDSPRNDMNTDVAVEYRHVDGIGWFNDPTRYNILGGTRNTAPRSEKKPANPDTTKAPHPRLSRLRTAASNINDKAEAFIDWMKGKISDKF